MGEEWAGCLLSLLTVRVCVHPLILQQHLLLPNTTMREPPGCMLRHACPRLFANLPACLPLCWSYSSVTPHLSHRRQTRVELARATGSGPPKKGQGKRAKK